MDLVQLKLAVCKGLPKKGGRLLMVATLSN